MPTDCRLCLYADAGGTKTTWTWSCEPILGITTNPSDLTDGGIGRYDNAYVTLGINPNTMGQQAIRAVLLAAEGILKQQLAAHSIGSWSAEGPNSEPEPTGRVVLTEVYYYGAGCGAQANRELMAGLIDQVYRGSPAQELVVHVDTDLAFAGLSQWGEEAGLVAILGTGCNVGLWQPTLLSSAKGQQAKGPIGKIVDAAPSLGFWLGDEGGGAWVGKQIMREYLLGEVPRSIVPILSQILGPTETLLQRFYQAASPAAMAGAILSGLATIGRADHPDLQPWLDNSIRAGFEAFVRTYVLPLSAVHGCKAVRCVGGMAWHYQALLAEVLARAGLRLDRVVQTPTLSIDQPKY